MRCMGQLPLATFVLLSQGIDLGSSGSTPELKSNIDQITGPQLVVIT